MSDLLNVRDLYVRYAVSGGLLGTKRANVDVVHGVSLDIKPAGDAGHRRGKRLRQNHAGHGLVRTRACSRRRSPF